jgi:hypothetical protein
VFIPSPYFRGCHVCRYGLLVGMELDVIKVAVPLYGVSCDNCLATWEVCLLRSVLLAELGEA